MRKSRGQELSEINETLDALIKTARMGTVTSVDSEKRTARLSWSDGGQSGALKILQTQGDWMPEIGSMVVSLHRVDGSGWIIGGYEGAESGAEIASITNAEIDEITQEWESGGSGGGSTTAGMDHALTTNRDAEDSHPISAISLLEQTLGGKISGSDRITNTEILEILNS